MSSQKKTPVKKITTHVYQISLGAVNCFIVEDPTGLTLVDTGYEGDEVKIYNALAQINKKPADIKQIVLTHLHADHAGSAAAIQQALSIPVYASERDGLLLGKGESLRGKLEVSKGLMNAILNKLFIKEIATIKPIQNIVYVSNKQILPFGYGMKVIFTPGHSEGHISLLVQADDLLIAGDICANNLSLTPSIVYENSQLGTRTLQQMNELNFKNACFGHGKPLLMDARKKMVAKFSRP